MSAEASGTGRSPSFVAPLAPRAPLVGRDRELGVLRAELAGAVAGSGRLALLNGAAGVGKTALTAVLCREAAGAGVAVLAGHCYDGTETPPYGPWLEVAQQARALALPDDAPPVPRLDGATSQAMFFAQARAFVAAATAARPLVLVLEDLHWADQASLDLLRHLAHALATLPLLLVVTYRGDELDRRHPLTALVPQLVREAPTARLDLRPFDADAAGALVRARYDLPAGEAARLAAYLLARTDGNALFLTERLRT